MPGAFSLRSSARLALVVIAFAQSAAAQTVPTPPGTPDIPGLLVSRQLLADQGLAVGDVIQLSASDTGDAARPFRVAGVYEPFPDPRRITGRRLEARLHLPDLIALTADPVDPLSAESVTTLHVALVDPAEASDVAQALEQRVPGLVARPTARRLSRSEPFVVIERFHLAIAAVTLLGSTMFLLALMVMRVEERRETAVVLRLIGVPTRRVLLNVFAEGVLIALAGVLFGVVVALLAQDGINRFFQWRYDTPLFFVRVTPAIIWRSAAYAAPFGLGAAVAGAWLLLRRDVLTLFRR